MELRRVGLPCTVIEAVERFAELGLEPALSSTAYVTEEELAGITEGYRAVAGYTRSGPERPS